jgi:hypothetical protein
MEPYPDVLDWDLRTPLTSVKVSNTHRILGGSADDPLTTRAGTDIAEDASAIPGTLPELAAGLRQVVIGLTAHTRRAGNADIME